MHEVLHHSHPDGTPYPAHECPIYAALRDGRVHAVDSEVFWTKDGTKIPVDYVSTPIWDEGQIQGAVVVFKDITERKRTEEHIRTLLSEAEARERQLVEKQAQLVQAAKLASIGELATGLAHELNNPLNNIALFVGNAIDLIEDDSTRPGDRLLANLYAAAEQVRRAGSIINHLRIFGRKGSELYQPVHVHPILESALAFIGERLRMGGIVVKCVLSSADPMVQGCPVQLEQVFVNLLANALDAMKDSRTKLIHIATAVESDSVCVRITDTGTGIPGDILSRIFDPFFTTKEVGLGTGLGLSISYGILKEHHGDITVQSVVGHGTEFLIHLPLHQ
jgi:C4-dicarboxylate-specific signal transduction histidine kinase